MLTRSVRYPGSVRHSNGSTRPSRPRGKRVTTRVLGGIGEIFITLGVLGLLFVAWELWWTGLGADRERQEAQEDFYSGLDIQAAPEEGGGASGSGSAPDFEVCYTLDDGTEIGCAPQMNAAADAGEVMGMLYAPRLGGQWAAPIRHGVGPEQLDTGGVGHYPDTQMVDEVGNFALAGHRQTYGDMLGDQHLLQDGDPLYVVSGDGIYSYEIYESHVVDPHQTEVIAPVPNDLEAEPETGHLTLTTCHPMYSNTERLITHAEVVDFQPWGGDVPEDIAHHFDDADALAGAH